MGERFQLKYIDNDGTEKAPVIIHRAPLGSHERFIGFLIEHFGGNFPTWLTPVQVKLLPITERNLDYAQRIAKILKGNGIRVEVDERNETLGGKIRDAQMEKVAYMLIVGDKEQSGGSVSVRARSGKDGGSQPLEKFVGEIKKEIEEKTIN